MNAGTAIAAMAADDLETLTDCTLALLGMALSEQDRREVLGNMTTLQRHAAIVMRETLGDDIEFAPEFRA